VTTGGATTRSLWARHVERERRSIREGGAWRSPRPFDPSGAGDSSGLLEGRGERVVAFASNDYLGLSMHPSVVEAGRDALDRFGAGAGASRLITGSRPVHHQLESELADWKNQERAVVFPTGYAANLGVLTTFGHRGSLIVSDQLNHASIVDGARLARAEVAVYGHRDTEQLERVLSENRGRPVIVVTDLVFSMDGDLAPVERIADLCRRDGALLVIDEAHSVLGPDPQPHLEDLDVLRVGTLSKTLGSVGGFVAGRSHFVELLENRARSYIFTTASPPASAAAALEALRILRTDEGTRLVKRLGFNVDLIAPWHPSPIVPVLLGSEEAALGASAQLLEAGFWVPAIRPPTVPRGTCRLRITLSAAHDEKDVSRLADELDVLRERITATSRP
jgi:8-amino-7-oxononanoate synthase